MARHLPELRHHHCPMPGRVPGIVLAQVSWRETISGRAGYATTALHDRNPDAAIQPDDLALSFAVSVDAGE